MAEPNRRRRTRTTIAGVVLLLIISGRRSEQPAGHESVDGGATGIQSTLGVIPEILDELAIFIGELRTRR